VRTRTAAPGGPRPVSTRRSPAGLALTWLGAILGALTSLVALLAGSYAQAYGKGEFRFGGYDYGCVDQACASAYSLAAILCFAAVGAYVLLACLSLSTSRRLLRAGIIIGLVAAGVIVGTVIVLDVGDDWHWPGLLAVPPALMGLGSWRRLRAQETARAGR
jgi:hypothetical protein